MKWLLLSVVLVAFAYATAGSIDDKPVDVGNGELKAATEVMTVEKRRLQAPNKPAKNGARKPKTKKPTKAAPVKPGKVAGDKSPDCLYWVRNGYPCSDPWSKANCATTCHHRVATETKVLALNEGTSDSVDGYQSYLNRTLEQPHAFRWSDPAKESWSCVDGRSTTHIYGTPGGDMGEFIMAYQTVANKSKISLAPGDLLVKYMNDVLTNENPFYLHTDSHSVEKIKTYLGASEKDEVGFFAKVAQQTKLLELLKNPDNHGCGHLKQMLLHPTEYLIPTATVLSLFRSFYLYAFQHENGKKRTHLHIHGDASHVHKENPENYVADYGWGEHDETSEVAGHSHLVSVPDDHNEEFILAVFPSSKIPKAGCKAPKIFPTVFDSEEHFTTAFKDGAKEFFVAHSLGGLVTEYRRKLVKFFLLQFTDLPQTPDFQEKTVKDINALSDLHLQNTLGFLQVNNKPIKTLPIISATYSSTSSTDNVC